MASLNDKIRVSEIENAKGYDSFVEDLNNNVEAKFVGTGLRLALKFCWQLLQDSKSIERHP